MQSAPRNMQSLTEMQNHLTGKASEDPTFRASLISDPKEAIHQEFGLTVPDGIKVQVHENDVNNVHLVLPPNSRLSDEQIEQVSGGFWE